MDENSLKINIQAIDDASGVLDGVAVTAQSMADELATIAGDVNTAFDGMSGATMGSTTAMEESFASLTSVMSIDSAKITDDMIAVGTSFDEAAVMATSADAQIAEGSAQMAESVNASSLSTTGGLLALGIAAQQAGEPLKKFYEDTIKASMDNQDAMATSLTLMQGVVLQGQQLAAGDGAISAAKADLVSKINAQKIAIEALQQPISGSNKTTTELGLAHAKAASEIAVHQATLDQLNGRLEIFDNMEKNANASATDLTDQIAKQAAANIEKGFSDEESIASISKLTAATGSLSEGMRANDVAMALSLVKHIDLKTASDAVSQSLQGNGKALQMYGIIIKDGLSGSQSLNAEWALLSNEMKNQNGTLGQSIRVLGAQWGDFMEDLGNTQTGILKPLIDRVTQVVVAVHNWTLAHPDLTKTLILFVGVLGTMLVAFGTLVTMAALVAGAIALLGGAIVGWIAAIAVGVTLIVTGILLNWTTLKNGTIAAFNGIRDFFKNVWEEIVYLFTSAIQGIMSMIDNLLNKINAVINGAKSIGANISKGIGGAISSVGNAISSVIPKFADGGIVNGPTIAMVGEAGPEAIIPLSMLGSGRGGTLGQGGAAINVYITGIVQSTEDQAKKLGDAIARQLNRSLKLQSFS